LPLEIARGGTILREGRRRELVIAAVCLAAIVALPETAGAVLSGTNGRIVLVSGRDQPSDATAKLYLRPAFGGVGAGTASPVTTATGAGQHRHPTWSPDRTMIAYAEGVGAELDIFILDLTDPGATPQNITDSPGVTEDRPAWSPDGTRIAYERGTPPDIFVRTLDPGGAINITASAEPDGKPAWSPDSQSIYYARRTPGGMGPGQDADIMVEPADNSGTAVLAVPDSEISEWQPSISPDGTRICFTLSVGAFDGSAEVFVAPLANPANQTNLSSSAGDDYNCTWSPDGLFITYVSGTLSNGDLVMERSDNSGGFVSLETTMARFDGNPDWAPDGRPQCDDLTVFAKVNTPVSIPLSCPDTGPAYEQTDVRAFPLSGEGPSNGTVAPDDPQLLPASFTYTPNAGFIGTDSFKVRSFDEVAFGDRDGTVTVSVQRPCAGRTVTKVGTPRRDFLRGTRRRDVIAGLGGNDVIRGFRGNDVLCGGRGKDRLIGGPGKDRLIGGPGRDRLIGGPGRDRLFGGPGRDVLLGGPGRDLLRGGPGRDKLRGGPGRDRQIQ
jgi:hypothetical protein